MVIKLAKNGGHSELIFSLIIDCYPRTILESIITYQKNSLLDFFPEDETLRNY